MGGHTLYSQNKSSDSPMNELKLISRHSDPVKPLIEAALSEALRSTEAGIRQTLQRLQAFETQYQLSTAEFIQRYSNDEFPETLELDEWIGESRMLARLQDKADKLRSIEFAN
jgi:hypothetical protein